MSLNHSKQQTNEESHDKTLVRAFSSHRQASGDTGDLPDTIKSAESSPEASLEDSLTSQSDQSLTFISCNSATPTLTKDFRQTPNHQQGSDTAEMSDSECSETNQTNLIVNYLPPYMSQDEVKALFSSVGEVESCKLVREKNTGESLGYAFVKFVKPSQARKAVDRLNGLRLQNKTIKVSLARPSSESIKGANLYICGLPKRMTQSEIEALFSRCGKIITARILYDNRTGISRGVAFIRFDQRHEAELAIKKLNGYRPTVEYPDAGPVEPIIVKFASSPTVLKQENLSMALLKQAVHGNALAKSFFANSFGGMKNSDIFMNHFLPSPFIPSPSGLNPQGWCLFVYNLAPETDESDLWQLFGPFGAVLSVRLSRDNWTHNCRGFAFITMTNYEEALIAVQSLNGVMLGDRLLQVSFKTHPGFKMRNLNLPPYYPHCVDDIISAEMQQLTMNGNHWKKSNSSFTKHTPGSKSLLKNFSVAPEDTKIPGEEEKISNPDN